MRIAFTTNVWGRFEILNVWNKAVEHIKKAYPDIDIIKIACGSEGHKSRKYCETLGMEYIESKNRPLAQKNNNRLRFTKKFKPDYVILLGSDDIINLTLFEKYLELIAKGFDLIELKDIYYFNAPDGKAAYCRGYTNFRKGEPIAPGRVISKKLLDKYDWNLWTGTQSPDYYAYKKLKDIKNKVSISLIYSKMALLDIKSKNNITPFKVRNNNYLIDAEQFLETCFPYLQDDINELHS